MSFHIFWTSIAQSNPNLSDDSTKMTLTVASFKAQLEKAYLAGMQKAISNAKAARDFSSLDSKPSGPFDDFGDLFKGLF